MTDKTFQVCLCAKSTSSGINLLLQKFAVYMLFGILSLCCLVSSVVDHMLLISGGFFMIVHMLFWGYSLVTLCYFVMGKLFLVHVVLFHQQLSFISLFIFILMQYTCKKMKHHYSTGYPMKCIWQFFCSFFPSHLHIYKHTHTHIYMCVCDRLGSCMKGELYNLWCLSNLQLVQCTVHMQIEAKATCYQLLYTMAAPEGSQVPVQCCQLISFGFSRHA